MSTTANLVRKQYLVSEENVKKVEKLASSKGTSATNIVRLAIDAYDPAGFDDLESPELIELVSSKLKESIAATKRANRKVAKTLKMLDEGAS